MALLSRHESIVWKEFQQGYSTSEISENNPEENWTPAYTSRVLNRARNKIKKILESHAKSHRLDIESIQDYKGLLIGFDFQANTKVYMVFTEKLGVIVWYRHDSYAGQPCQKCPKEKECAETLATIRDEFNIILRSSEMEQAMTQRSIEIFNKLAAKEIPRYRRKMD
jgi:hypothetical protein